MVSSPRHNVLVIDFQSASRFRLREVLRNHPQVGKVLQVSSAFEAIAKLENGACPPLIFASSRALGESKELSDAIRNVRDQLQLKVVLVAHVEVQRLDRLASRLAAGYDAILAEPFSVDEISKLFSLIDEKLLAAADKRKQATVTLLAARAINTLDQAALAMVRSSGQRPNMRDFHEVGRAISELEIPPDELASHLIELLEHAPVKEDYEAARLKYVKGRERENAMVDTRRPAQEHSTRTSIRIMKK